jgi:hypothetical protein
MAVAPSASASSHAGVIVNALVSLIWPISMRRKRAGEYILIPQEEGNVSLSQRESGDKPSDS